MFQQVAHEWFLGQFRLRRGVAVKRSARIDSYRRPLRFETLEERRLLSITVNTLIDENDGINVGGISLREAIAAAAPGDTINFAPSLTANGPATILLTHGELSVDKSLTIDGPGANLLTIDASGNDPTPNVDNGDGSRVLSIVDSSVGSRTVQVQGVTLTGGDKGDGGIGPYRGGAIYARGVQLIVADSVITGNYSGSGGGIYVVGGNSLASSVIERTTVANNHAGGGAGILAQPAKYGIEIRDCSITGNNSAAGGGGIYTTGGITSNAKITIVNSTISGNAAGWRGAGIEIEYGYRVQITSSTITGNSGPGIFVYNSTATLRNVIVSGNTEFPGSTSSLDIATSFFSSPGAVDAAYSLIGNNRASGLAEAPIGAPDAHGNLVGGPVHGLLDPKLGPLTNNGGPTATRALLPGSPAINAGNPATVAGNGDVPQFDQRSAPFGRVVGGRIDIGAVEAQPNPLPGDYNFDGVVDAADYVVWRATLGSVTDLRADGSGNGVIDGDDRNSWMAHFGQALAGSGSAAEFTVQESTVARAIGVGSGQAAATIASGSVGGREIDLLLPLVKTGPVGARLLANGLADHSAFDCSRDNALLNWIESQSRSWPAYHESLRDLSSLDPTNHESADSRDVAFDDVFEKLVAII